MYRNTCILYLRSDPTLFNKFMEDLDNNEIAARDEILSLFASHVTALNQIYNNAEFRPFNATSPCYQGIRFQIQRTKIMTNETEKCHDNLNKSAFCQPEISVGDFINLNSLENHDEFCLAYTFTYRDFAKSTLGLSWIGKPSGPGGICEKYKPYTNKDKHIWKSLNTGVVSIVNYNKRIPQRVSEITFAHEVGHSLGSPHDNRGECYHFGTSHPISEVYEEGNYLMFESPTQGNLPNNDKFSNCSLEKIANFIDDVVNQRNGKVNCFTESGEAFCGNGIVEQGEECDCGYEEECTDVCSNPRRTGGQNNDLSCTRKINPNTYMKYECSPTQGPCCSKECSFVAASSNLICRGSTDCRKEQTCRYPLGRY